MTSGNKDDPLDGPPGYIEDYLTLQVRRLAKQTQVNRRGALRRWIDWLDGRHPHGNLEPIDIEYYLLDLEEGDENYAGGTIRHHIAAIRDYYAWCEDKFETPDLAAGLDTEHIERNTRRSQLLDEADLVEYLELNEMRALLDAATNARERLVILLLLETGARVGEIRRLKTSAVNFDENSIRMPNSKEMLKESKTRVIPILTSVTDQIREWKNIDRHQFPRTDSSYLVPGKTGNQIRTEEISDIVREAAKRGRIQLLLNETEVKEGA